MLLLEDHDLAARIIMICLAKAGHHPIGPFHSCAAAMTAAADYNAAILDLGLPDGPPFAFAMRLMERGLPFVFYTGSEPHDIPPALQTVPVLIKGHKTQELMLVLEPLARARLGQYSQYGQPIACP